MSDASPTTPDPDDVPVDSKTLAGDAPSGLSGKSEQPVTRSFSPEEAARAAQFVPHDPDDDDSDAPLPDHFGKYTIEHRIGRGGMGVVWKARDPALARTVAIKVLAPQLAHSRTARQRFLREARAAAAISHPNVLTIHAVEEQDQSPFIVMEFVDGGSLKDFVTQTGRLPPLQVIQLSAQIAQGLAAAHAQGVIHRDVKPGNVMLHAGGLRVRLADFGLARVTFDNSELTSHDQAVGTPAYMSPEQLRGERVDSRADLFSLGCVIYFMLVGYSPFQGRTQGETIHKILGEQHRTLLEVDPLIPPMLNDLVERLLHKDPEQRYQSAYEVGATLTRLLNQLNQAATDEIGQVLSRTVPITPQRQDRRLIAGLAAGAAALAVGGWLWSSKPAGTASSDVVHSAVASTGGPLALSHDPAREPAVLTVARDGSGQYSNLDDAVRNAIDGDTIRVLDAGTYSVQLRLQERTGVTLEAMQGAELVPGPPDSVPISIGHSRDIRVQGFRIQTTLNRNAIQVRDSSGVQLLDLSIRQVGAKNVPAIGVDRCNPAATDNPFVVRGCRVETLSSGQCIWVSAENEPMHRLVIEDNEFHGVSKGTLGVFKGLFKDVRLQHNLFAGGHVAWNLGLEGTSEPGDIRIANNTFHNCRAWLGLMSTDPTKTRFTLVNNLVLNCEKIEANQTQVQAAVRDCILGGNVWERAAPPGGLAELSGWARYQEVIPVQSRDPSDPGYLRLPAESALLTGGLGGDFAAHVGARP